MKRKKNVSTLPLRRYIIYTYFFPYVIPSKTPGDGDLKLGAGGTTDVRCDNLSLKLSTAVAAVTIAGRPQRRGHGGVVRLKNTRHE